MSKRAGNVVTIDDLVSVVGVDACPGQLAGGAPNTTSTTRRADRHRPRRLLASHTNDNRLWCSTRTPAPTFGEAKNVDHQRIAAAGISYEGAGSRPERCGELPKSRGHRSAPTDVRRYSMKDRPTSPSSRACSAIEELKSRGDIFDDRQPPPRWPCYLRRASPTSPPPIY